MKKIVFILFVCFCVISCNESDTLTLEKTLTVASQKADCVGVAPQKCLLVKEEESVDWQYFYGSILGFTYQEGFEYVIIVSEEEIKNPPQDGSSIKTTLLEVVSKIEKRSENLPN